MNTIFQRTNRTLEFGFSNVLQIMSGNAISRHMFLIREFYLEFEIRITFLYDKQFQQMTLFSKELRELYNSASATLLNYVRKYNFFCHATFKRRLFLKLKL